MYKEACSLQSRISEFRRHIHSHPELSFQETRTGLYVAEKLKEAGDYEGLAKIPRNAFKTRSKNRCAVSGRARGYHRKFGISRIALRELSNYGVIPGVTKSSW